MRITEGRLAASDVANFLALPAADPAGPAGGAGPPPTRSIRERICSPGGGGGRCSALAY